MGLVMQARAAQRLIPPAIPEPPQDGPLRGYFVGLAPRKVGDILPATATRAKGVVVEAKWSDAQPTQADNASGLIDPAVLADIDAAIALGPPYDVLKVRIFTGIHSPDWAKALAGGPISWGNGDGTVFHDVPVWFSDAFLDAYEAFVEALAAELSTRSSKIVEVTLAGATTIYSEPCIRQIGWDANHATAAAFGYTDAVDLAAIKRCIDIHHEHMSPLGIVTSVAYNSFQWFTEDGRGKVRLSSAFELMNYQRDVMGKYGVWENNSLGAMADGLEAVQARSGDYPDLYAYMAGGAADGVPVQFQTMNRVVMNEKYPGVNCLPTARYAVDIGGISVEMPGALQEYPDWTVDITEAEADEINADLLANAQALPYYPS